MLAEFMLHRTKAEQVEPVYIDFIDKYPDIQSLSKAKYGEIKKITKHLGLHWRSKHFIRSARFIAKKYHSKFPRDRQQLLKISGVGDYVAGAILTVCFRKSVHVVDSNIARFINRLLGLNLKGEIRRKKIIIEKAKELFRTKRPDLFLFAILDFTALICKPIDPNCEICILRKKCVFGKKHGVESSRGRKHRKINP
jgi:A/G-specific adenine glycosylase